MAQASSAGAGRLSGAGRQFTGARRPCAKRRLVVGLLRRCVLCDVVLPSGAQHTDDPNHCTKCSVIRSRRCQGNWVNRGCYAAQPCPASAKRLCPSLADTFDATDCMGSIFCLNVRPDVGGLKHFSKGLLSTEKSDHDRLAWFLVAHRLYDPADNIDVVLPFACKHKLTPKSLVKLSEALEKEDGRRSKKRYGDDGHSEQWAKLRTNPTGSAAAHSGRAWLRDVIATEESVLDFCKAVSVIQPIVFARKHQNWAHDFWNKILEAKFAHSATYYNMQIFRAVRHAFDLRDRGNNARFPPCTNSRFLWSEILLKHQGGAKSRAAQHNLDDYDRACKFVKAMQTAHPDFDLCSLACWLCLSSCAQPPTKRAKPA